MKNSFDLFKFPRVDVEILNSALLLLLLLSYLVQQCAWTDISSGCFHLLSRTLVGLVKVCGKTLPYATCCHCFHKHIEI